MNKFTILSEETILTTELFEVRKQRIRKVSGRDATWYNVFIHAVSFVLPVTDKKEVYLIRQYRHNLKQQSLELVAGFIDKHETPQEAAQRELKEEAGITAVKWQMIGKKFSGTTAAIGEIYYFVAFNYWETTTR